MGLQEEFSDFARYRDGVALPTHCAKPALMVAMTPRTGSTYLCAELAAAAGVYGVPDEIFNPRGVVQNIKTVWRVSTFADYVAAFSRQLGPYFIFKSSWHDFRVVAPLYRQMFPDLKIIYLDRLDIIAQAVSMFRAMTTRLWHKDRQGKLMGQVEEYGLLSPQQIRASFDLARINAIIENLEQERRGWRGFFNAETLEPVRVSYEGFAEDVAAAVRYIGAALDLRLDGTGAPMVSYARLSDEINEEWVERVRAARR